MVWVKVGECGFAVGDGRTGALISQGRMTESAGTIET